MAIGGLYRGSVGCDRHLWAPDPMQLLLEEVHGEAGAAVRPHERRHPHEHVGARGFMSEQHFQMLRCSDTQLKPPMPSPVAPPPDGESTVAGTASIALVKCS